MIEIDEGIDVIETKNKKPSNKKDEKISNESY